MAADGQKHCLFCQKKGKRSKFILCSKCGAVLYCSESCRIQDCDRDDIYSHAIWCQQMTTFMAKTAQLADLPFTFAHKTTHADFTTHRLCSFLKEMGVYRQGYWRWESPPQPGELRPKYGNLPVTDESYVLPVETFTLEDCPLASPPPTPPLLSWQQYYDWRGLRLDSPVAVLLQWPLTLYHVVVNRWPEDYPGQGVAAANGSPIVIHLVGVAQEVDIPAVFGELGKLLPHHEFNIHMFGLEISNNADGRQHEMENVQLTIHKMHYHAYTGDRPQLVLGYNAGLAAYPEWRASLIKLRLDRTPAYFTDYCQHCAALSGQCIEECGIGEISNVEINPFRSPLRKYSESHDMPLFSNAFIFRILFKRK